METEISANDAAYSSEIPGNEIPTSDPEQIQQSKKKILKSVFFGLLSVIITPILAWIILPFIQSGELSILGVLSGIGAGPFLAPFFLIAILGAFALSGQPLYLALILPLLLISVVVTGLIAWFILKSKRLAIITFYSAVVIQIALFSWLAYIGLKVIPPTKQLGATTTNNPDVVACQGECVYTQYAKIGVPSVAFKEQFDFSYAINGQMDTARVYKKAEVQIPLTIQRNGNYEIIADYGYSSQTKNEYLEIGERILSFEFVHGNYDKYGWSDKEKDILRIRMSYLATKEELITQMNQENAEQNPAMQALTRRAQEAFFNDNKNLSTTVRKFVVDKEIEL